MTKQGWIAKVDRDYINRGTGHSTVGRTIGTVGFSFDKADSTRWRLLDDDGEVYFGGWMIDNDYADAQDALLAWAGAKYGCTTIQERQGDEWVAVIG